MRFKKIIIIVIGLCLAVTIAGLFVFINLPGIVEKQIEKQLVQYLNSNDIEFQIQKLGFLNTLISKIRITKGISIDSVNIDYDITKLPDIQLKKITLSGLSIHADLDENNHIQIKGFDFSKLSKHGSQNSNVSVLPPLNFLPGKIVLQNGKIILHTVDDEFLIPFEALSILKLKDEKIEAQVRVFPFGEKINVLVTYDLNKGIQFLKIEGKSFDSGYLNQFISKKTDRIILKGLVDFNLESSSPQEKWKLDISNIGLVQPAETAIKDLSTTLLIDKQVINASGTFDIRHPLLPEIPVAYTLALDLKENHNFDLRLKNRHTDNFQLAYGSTNKATLKNPRLNAQFSGTPLKAKGNIRLDFKGGSVQYLKEALLFDTLEITSDLNVDFTKQGKGLFSKWVLTSNNLKIQSELMTGLFPFAGASGQIFLDKKNNPSVNFTLKALGGEVSSPKFKIKAFGVDIKVPISYPSATKGLSGTYSIPVISYQEKYEFNAKGKIFQKSLKTFGVTGRVMLKTLPGLKASFDAMVGFEKGMSAALKFKTNSVKLNDTDIEMLAGKFPQTAEIDLTVSATGKAEFRDHQTRTSMILEIKDGAVRLPDMNLAAEGINTSVSFNDLLILESIPGQVLTIDSIKVNDIIIDDAKIQFSIEDAASLLVENIRFKWCNGLVSTESIRIPQENNTYSLTLYCDRLELTSLLKQVGAFNAEGTGTLNGRIPVLYSDGIISFDNGFLFSTPGSGGKIVVENTDMITSGIPMDSPQFSQLDLAREALKAFDYKWAKLSFHTFDGTLYVNMELDGKPSKLLPFEYRKELGGFIRVDASSPGSHFQGIKLDINLKLPFNEVMKFGNKLQSIFNQ